LIASPSLELAKGRLGDGGTAGPKIEEVNVTIDWPIYKLIIILKSVYKTLHLLYLLLKHELEYSAK
jgi:hypothetical protein